MSAHNGSTVPTTSGSRVNGVSASRYRRGRKRLDMPYRTGPGLSAAEDVAKVLHRPSPVEQCRVVPVLGAKVLDQGHIVVEVERPDQSEQVGRLASNGGNRGDEPVVEFHYLVNHRQVARAGCDGGEVRRGEVLGEDDRLDCQGPWSVALGEMDKQLDVEG